MWKKLNTTAINSRTHFNYQQTLSTKPKQMTYSVIFICIHHDYLYIYICKIILFLQKNCTSQELSLTMKIPLPQYSHLEYLFQFKERRDNKSLINTIFVYNNPRCAWTQQEATSTTIWLNFNYSAKFNINLLFIVFINRMMVTLPLQYRLNYYIVISFSNL